MRAGLEKRRGARGPCGLIRQLADFLDFFGYFLHQGRK
jgi:hypothetical protein